jgi:hypothetical protein
MIMAQARSTLINWNRRLSRRKHTVSPCLEAKEWARMEKSFPQQQRSIFFGKPFSMKRLGDTSKKHKTRNSEKLGSF